MDNVQVLSRYEGYKASIEQMVLEVVKEQLNRRQGAADNITRNFIKFLTTACGLMEVRHLGKLRKKKLKTFNFMKKIFF